MRPLRQEETSSEQMVLSQPSSPCPHAPAQGSQRCSSQEDLLRVLGQSSCSWRFQMHWMYRMVPCSTSPALRPLQALTRGNQYSLVYEARPDVITARVNKKARYQLEGTGLPHPQTPFFQQFDLKGSTISSLLQASGLTLPSSNVVYVDSECISTAAGNVPSNIFEWTFFDSSADEKDAWLFLKYDRSANESAVPVKVYRNWAKQIAEFCQSKAISTLIRDASDMLRFQKAELSFSTVTPAQRSIDSINSSEQSHFLLTLSPTTPGSRHKPSSEQSLPSLLPTRSMQRSPSTCQPKLSATWLATTLSARILESPTLQTTSGLPPGELQNDLESRLSTFVTSTSFVELSELSLLASWYVLQCARYLVCKCSLPF